MLSKAALSTIFWVFGMTWPGIEPWSPRPFMNTLLIRAIDRLFFLKFVEKVKFGSYWLLIIDSMKISFTFFDCLPYLSFGVLAGCLFLWSMTLLVFNYFFDQISYSIYIGSSKQRLYRYCYMDALHELLDPLTFWTLLLILLLLCPHIYIPTNNLK